MGIDISGILEDLAAGRIDADEASRRIDELRAASAEPDPSSGQRARADKADRTDKTDKAEKARRRSGVERLVVQSTGKRVRLIGDADIATVMVDGQHLLRRNGSVLEVVSNGEIGPSFGGFSLINPPRSLDDLRDIGLGRELVVKANPELRVDVEVTGGGLAAVGVPHLGKVRVTAAAASVEGVAQVEDMLVQAGAANVSGPIRRGRSRLRVESGNLSIRLHPGSNVTVRGDSRLGRVSLPDGHGEMDELIVGNGSARLDVSAVMGYASVRVVEEDFDE